MGNALSRQLRKHDPLPLVDVNTVYGQLFSAVDEAVATQVDRKVEVPEKVGAEYGGAIIRYGEYPAEVAVQIQLKSHRA